ncbi:MAG: Quinoprotein glucose dehydrogenase, partial [Verrucomicrobiales bacterium]|nr:Quinoprotein glucose dehydrogenase [Verrucomicrobiales bacterium]
TTNDINPYFKEEKRDAWRKRIADAHTGLFEPLSDKYETIAMPGVTGGANFGNTAADPERGLVYVTAQEFPSVLKLKLDTRGSDSRVISADQLVRAKSAYVLYCQACHGVNREGMALIPAVTNLNTRLSYDNFVLLIGVGKGQMPGFPHIDERTLSDLYAYCGGVVGNRTAGPNGQQPRNRPSAMATTNSFTGPIVATGGALGTNQPPYSSARNALRGYPEGVTGPTNRYSTGYGLENPDLLQPPWSIIAAYDLNKGTLKWRKPLGQDPSIPYQGGTRTGVPNGSQRKGMIVTSTGLLFASCKDGKIYAYDSENGEVLWSFELPRHPEGLLSMYEVNGRQYLEVCSMDFVINKAKPPAYPPAYIVFSLPEKKAIPR